MLRTSEFILNFVLNSAWQIAVIFAVTALCSWLLKEWASALSSHALGRCARRVFVVPLLTATRFVPEFRVFKWLHHSRPSSGS
jgi:hypothetical protein